jgi:hypothetical protein
MLKPFTDGWHDECWGRLVVGIGAGKARDVLSTILTETASDRYSAGENAAIEVLSMFDPELRLGTDPSFLVHAVALVNRHPGLITVTEYDSDGKGTMRPCLTVLERTLPFTGTFGYNMTTLNALYKKFGERAKKAAESTADWKAVMHAIRVIDEGITLYRTGKLVLPFPDPSYVAHLHDIRLGRIPRDEANAEVDHKVAVLVALKDEASWQLCTPELTGKLEEWLLGWLRRFYFEPLPTP